MGERAGEGEEMRLPANHVDNVVVRGEAGVAAQVEELGNEEGRAGEEY